MEENRLDSLVIRDFVDGDFASIVKLWEQSGVASPSRGDSLESIHSTIAARGRILVLESRANELRAPLMPRERLGVAGLASKGEVLASHKEIIASVWLTDDGRRLYIHHMAVLPEWQGRGLGKRLMEHAVGIAQERGLQMKLEVGHDNDRAIALYRHFGFEALGDYEVMIRRGIG